jgi:drug/metabolite transporter (DMT)-like permease
MPSASTPSQKPPRFDAATLWLLLIAASWGFNWPAVKLALNEMPVWSMRAAGMSIGALLLLAFARIAGRSLKVVRAEWPALVIAGLLNMTAFNILTAFAQTRMPTSRVVILAYTMPLWAALLAWLILGERLARHRLAALALGAAGLAVIVAPLAPQMVDEDVQIGTLSILGAALSWAAGTVHIKRAALNGDPIATTGWQLAFGAATAWLGYAAFEAGRAATFWPVTAWSWGGLIYNGVFGVALSYLLWFSIVARLPAATAAIGTLLVPVVGVVSAMAIIGDRPSPFDYVGFALIVAAVLLNMRAQR